MLVVVERRNFEHALQLLKSMGKAEVFVPRPLSVELFEKIDPYVERYFMPPSTYARLSRAAKGIVGGRVEIMSRRGRFAEIDVETVTQILALRRAGLSIREIARDTGLPKSTVHYILSRERKIRDGNVKIIVQ